MAIAENNLVLLALRVVLGIVMIYYGYPKVKNLRSNGDDFVKMGFKPGVFWGTIVAFTEFFGGIAVLIGLYAELAAALFGFQMITGTFWKLKVKKKFSDYSYDLQLLVISLAIIIFGPGSYAISSFDLRPYLRLDFLIVAVVVGALLVYLPLLFNKKERFSS